MKYFLFISSLAVACVGLITFFMKETVTREPIKVLRNQAPAPSTIREEQASSKSIEITAVPISKVDTRLENSEATLSDEEFLSSLTSSRQLGKISGAIPELSKRLQSPKTSLDNGYKFSEYLIQESDSLGQLQFVSSELAKKFALERTETFDNSNKHAHEFVMNTLMDEQRFDLAESYYAYVRDMGQLSQPVLANLALVYATNGDISKAINLLVEIPNKTDDVEGQLARYYWMVGENQKSIEIANSLRLRGSPVMESLTSIPFELT